MHGNELNYFFPGSMNLLKVQFCRLVINASLSTIQKTFLILNLEFLHITDVRSNALGRSGQENGNMQFYVTWTDQPSAVN